MLGRGSWSTGEIIIRADRSSFILDNMYFSEDDKKNNDLFIKLGIKNRMILSGRRFFSTTVQQMAAWNFSEKNA